MLIKFLRAAASSPFDWGNTDCCLMLADWWMLNHGVDPAAHLRGSYGTEAECQQILDKAGGVLKLVSGLAHSVGARPAYDPRPGDFGVISARNFRFGAILTPTMRWFVKTPDGACGFRGCDVLMVWSL